ncbi:MAG: stage II sporulation protein P [Eubacteriales bacterium]|nr:stage II sporulation protein P [Eubacteriales bacterium]
MPQKSKRKIQTLELLLSLIFLAVWLLIVSERNPADTLLWKKMEDKLPLNMEIWKSAGEDLLKGAQKELIPFLGYENCIGGNHVMLPFMRGAVQKELFPLQQYSIDYWNGNDWFSSVHGDVVPEYFKEADDAPVEDKKTNPGVMETKGAGESYTEKQLTSYDFLLRNFYIVDETARMTREDLVGESLIKKDMSVKLSGKKPLVFIYHTHGSETYREEKGKVGSVLEVGEALKKELETNYGISVIHDTTIYDRINGELDRNAAYDYAGDSVSMTLRKYPSIKVVLDVHRDSVEDSIRLVTKIGGRKTAQIMFFNGVSRLKDGELEYLYNPNKRDNLAFSLQMQLLAAKYYPGFTRKIYIKGYRYNLHLVKRAMLVEVGAQNNTVSEAKNAMKPLAELLYRLLSGELRV